MTRDLRVAPGMFPKEHGAYGQLLFPIATALGIGRPGVSAAALVAAATCLFLAHEPALVLLGQRGPRAGRDHRRRAIAWFTGFSAIALVSGIVAVYAASPAARSALVLPLVLALLLVLVIAAGREHTVAGEVASAIALSSVAYPIGVASMASSRASLSCAAAFAATFVVGVVCVHAVIGFTRRPPAVAARMAGAAAAIGAAGLCYVLGEAGTLEIITPIAVVPASLAGVALVAFPPSARKLRVVGWTLVASSLLTTVVLLAALR